MNELPKNALWKPVSEIREQTLQYILDRRDGIIKSVKTPWQNVNNALLEGLEWGGFIIVAARPGVGKTAFVDQIAKEINVHNPGLDIGILKFQFEMTDRMTGAREMTSVTDLSLKELFSARTRISEEDILKITRYMNKRKDDNIFQISQPRTAKDFRQDVISFHNFIKKPILVILDHSILTKRATDEQSQLESLYNLSQEIVYLKKLFPDSIYIVLSQMNRNMEKPERREPGKIGNYPTSDDIFGADALMQNCDATLALTRPDKLGIFKYGQEKFIVTPGLIVGHFLKNRYGETDMLFFKEDLKYFQIDETRVPDRSK